MKAKLTLPDQTEIIVDISQEDIELIRVPETGRFVPDPDRGYWFINGFGKAQMTINEGAEMDVANIELGNAYESEAATNHALAVQKARLRLEDSTKGFKPDWANLKETKYFVEYQHLAKELVVDYWSTRQAPGQVYYRNTADARAAIQTHREDFLLVMGIRE